MNPDALARIRAVRRASQVLRGGAWDGGKAVDRVVLDADERFRRRVVLTGEAGTRFLLDLPEATALRDGDALALDDGTLVAVIARPESVVEIAAADPAALARLAWHLGNRHTELEILHDRLRMRRDHVLEEMLAGLGARLSFAHAPFEPERGAYAHADGRAGDGGHDG